MIINQRDDRHAAVIDACKAMMIAARTAPKARGVDIVECAVVADDDLARLSEAMMGLYKQTGRGVFERDSRNILHGDAVVIIGTPTREMGLNCGLCGSPTCDAKSKSVPCAFNDIDLGIAVGSAVSVAADHRLDTRVMYSAGMGALALNLLDGCKAVIAIAVSATSKNPYFDR